MGEAHLRYLLMYNVRRLTHIHTGIIVNIKRSVVSHNYLNNKNRG